jgi:hypothetical protein
LNKNKKAVDSQKNRRLSTFTEFAFLRWHYPTGSRGLPDYPFREFSAGSAPPADPILFKPFFENCQ